MQVVAGKHPLIFRRLPCSLFLPLLLLLLLLPVLLLLLLLLLPLVLSISFIFNTYTRATSFVCIYTFVAPALPTHSLLDSRQGTSETA